MIRFLATSAVAICLCAIATGDVRKDDDGIRDEPSESNPKYDLIVHVSAKGAFFVANRRVTEARLVEMARAITKRVAEPKLLIRASRDAEVVAIKRLTRATGEGGIKKVTFGTWDGALKP